MAEASLNSWLPSKAKNSCIKSAKSLSKAEPEPELAEVDGVLVSHEGSDGATGETPLESQETEPVRVYRQDSDVGVESDKSLAEAAATTPMRTVPERRHAHQPHTPWSASSTASSLRQQVGTT